jgi:hypothetical protein
MILGDHVLLLLLLLFHPHSLLHSIVGGFQTVLVSLTKHFIFTDLSKKFFSIWHVFSISAFSGRMYTGRRLNSFKFSCTLFGIIPVLYSTSDIIQSVFSCHISYKLFFQVCVLLELIGDPYYYYYYYYYYY